MERGETKETLVECINKYSLYMNSIIREEYKEKSDWKDSFTRIKLFCEDLMAESREKDQRIAELEKQLEEKWFDVDELLPEGNKSVLCFGGVDIFIGYYDEESKFFYSSAGKRIATHWRPLPSAPKLEEKK